MSYISSWGEGKKAFAGNGAEIGKGKNRYPDLQFWRLISATRGLTIEQRAILDSRFLTVQSENILCLCLCQHRYIALYESIPHCTVPVRSSVGTLCPPSFVIPARISIPPRSLRYDVRRYQYMIQTDSSKDVHNDLKLLPRSKTSKCTHIPTVRHALFRTQTHHHLHFRIKRPFPLFKLLPQSLCLGLPLEVLGDLREPFLVLPCYLISSRLRRSGILLHFPLQIVCKILDHSLSAMPVISDDVVDRCLSVDEMTDETLHTCQQMVRA